MTGRETDWPWVRAPHGKPIDVELEGVSWPRLTVVMPSFNQARYIEESIRSVLLQGYPNLEFMIFDGGSSDGTVDIIQKYDDSIDYWESCSDGGQSHAINKGCARATGAYIAWLNSDDLYYPGALFHIAKAVLEHPDAGLIYGSGSKIDSQSKIIRGIPARKFDKRLLQTRFYMLQQASFYKRSLFGSQMVDENLHYTMDWELAIRISRSSPVCRIEQDIGMFRIHSTCKTQTGDWERRKEIARVGRRCNGPLDPNHLLLLLFGPIFKHGLCQEKPGRDFGNHLCHWWRRMIGIVLDPETHMMH